MCFFEFLEFLELEWCVFSWNVWNFWIFFGSLDLRESHNQFSFLSDFPAATSSKSSTPWLRYGPR